MVTALDGANVAINELFASAYLLVATDRMKHSQTCRKTYHNSHSTSEL
jgi:hypothetical protein